ncbi:hypothetical protein [Pseudaestuariivita sp.]|uniref:hypothetical protein n=1 Tax=Pseudaestuariivita sp. TaxID=2211669 RepID=UPI004058AD73
MSRFTASLAVAVLMGSAAPVAGDEHVVAMLGQGFFPMNVYLQSGDTVRFMNFTNNVQVAAADDGSWTTGEVAAGADHVVTILSGMRQTFLANGTAEIQGAFYFGVPPLHY